MRKCWGIENTHSTWNWANTNESAFVEHGPQKKRGRNGGVRNRWRGLWISVGRAYRKCFEQRRHDNFNEPNVLEVLFWTPHTVLCSRGPTKGSDSSAVETTVDANENPTMGFVGRVVLYVIRRKVKRP